MNDDFRLPDIDWRVVTVGFDHLTQDANNNAYLHDKKPYRYAGGYWESDGNMIDASVFASYMPGFGDFRLLHATRGDE